MNKNEDKAIIQEQNEDVPLEKVKQESIGDNSVTDDKIVSVSAKKIKSGNIINKIFNFITPTLSFTSSVLNHLSSTINMINATISLKHTSSDTTQTDIEEKVDGLYVDLRNALVLSNKYNSGFVIVPKITDTYDIGVTGKRFKDMYLSGNCIIGGKNAVKSGNHADDSWTVTATTSSAGDPAHVHTVSLIFYTTTIIKDGVEYYVFKHQ